MRRAVALLLAGLLSAAAHGAEPPSPSQPASAPGVFFDDFSEPDVTALRAAGWILRDKPGHPGVDGARWAPEGVSLVDDETVAGNRLLRLSAHTDGTGPGTEQVQLCHARKYLNGTYAARVRYDSSRAGDALVQAFYTAAPLRFDYDPEYSELDWEYLPYGGWDVAQPRLYSVSWQTVRIKPWDSYNASHEEFGFLTGWHVLVTQVADGHVRWFLDGREVALHGGRNHPVVPMAISFSDWFIREGPFAKSDAPRVYQEDVDWVFHAQDRVLSPAQVEAAVRDYRQRGVARVDEVPASGLESRCDL
ncbi:MAG: glycoside hydrolase family 16 protein [Paucibacter sp.]|nr:glycoside hydrolase family 16 protein [Roseateles sp.]